MSTPTKTTARDALLAVTLATHEVLPKYPSLFEAVNDPSVREKADGHGDLHGLLQNAVLSSFAGLIEDDIVEVARAYQRIGWQSEGDHQDCCSYECSCSLRSGGECDACEARLVARLDERLDSLLESITAGTSMTRVLRVMGAVAA
jgi:hypothetical protein